MEIVKSERERFSSITKSLSKRDDRRCEMVVVARLNSFSAKKAQEIMVQLTVPPKSEHNVIKGT